MKITFLKISLAAFLLSGLTIIGCQKDAAPKTQVTFDSSKVTTQYNQSIDLSNYSTIAVSDSVFIAGDTSGKELTTSEAAYVQAFKDSLSARGFSVVAINSNPSLVLNITRISSTSTGNIDSSSYWNKYATFYNPSIYGFANATYVNNFSVYNPVSTGVLSFELLDVKDVSLLNQISIIWNGQVAGKAIYDNASFVKQAVGILLEKSPLKRNP
jgi:hypothetical protein